LYQFLGATKPAHDVVEKALQKLGVEVVEFSTWPGFAQDDYKDSYKYTDKIVTILEKTAASDNEEGGSMLPAGLQLEFDPYKKAEPEAEAYTIVKNERGGDYHMISEKGIKSPSWFISNTSILNYVEGTSRITWQTEAFIKFTSTISPLSKEDAADRAFETLLWACAQAGVNLLEEKVIESVFGGIIDEATTNVLQQRQLYNETIENKYGEPIESVLDRVAPKNRLLAAIQLQSEISQAQQQRLQHAEKSVAVATKQAAELKKELVAVEKYRKKLEAKKLKAGRNRRKQQSKKQGKGKKKR
jgi:hypothetical protein